GSKSDSPSSSHPSELPDSELLVAAGAPNQLGRLVNEVLIFDGSLVTQGHGTYLGSGANPAGVTSR
ncbi:MAG: hypothetical protein ACRDTT_34810, partial [Pseudonocardiaceae bacterium]